MCGPFGIFNAGRYHCHHPSNIESQRFIQFNKVRPNSLNAMAYVDHIFVRNFNVISFLDFFRQNIQRSDAYQYRVQAWNMENMEETYLPDFTQSTKVFIYFLNPSEKC